MDERLRALPSVDEVLSGLAEWRGRFPHRLMVSEIRRVLERARAAIRSGEALPENIEAEVVRSLQSLERPSLRHVINATGVILHTNLGRAPLAPLEPIAGYTNLEYNLATGRRGKRDVHAGELLERLLGQPAIAVNNNAAAVYLVLHELAAGGEVIVSRGELIEIGDGFRIPEIMAHSGAALREVGTTNRTRISDYRDAINENTRLLLRVHPSNFRMQGFTAKPSLSELVALGRECGVPVYEDLGSGCVADLREFGFDEPLASASLDAGVGLVSFSGDKLLGGPQAGIIGGDAGLIARLRRNPMYRALRLDKLLIQALETSLRSLLLERWSEVPTLRMIRADIVELRTRSERVAAQLTGVGSEIVEGESVVGGGTTPGQAIPTWLIAISVEDVEALERRLREADPPVIARIVDGRLLIDLRTVFPEEDAELVRAITQARS